MERFTRRVRYPGTHPRQFKEKYKELDPERYPETRQKVLASGKTPAGSHRPICVEEILAVLAPEPGELAVDATLGYGGHAAEILPRLLPGGRLLGVDADPIESARTEARFRAQGYSPEVFTVRHTSFAALPRLLAAQGLTGADMVLADLGCSSMQLDDPARGFSFKHDGPLDMRLNPNKGRPASVWLATMDENALVEVLRENADEPHAQLIAQAIAQARSRQALDTTRALAETVREALATLPRSVQLAEGEAPIRRTFQAVRLAVNDEFGALEALLRFLPDCLKPGGRVAILSFHSGEDRRVKQAFAAGYRAGLYARIARELVRPSLAEVRANPRAASAKLRWAVRA